ncbi:DoxX family protein [Limnobacter parvus]|uniref:DoxX family protein n=1 Tax=Limnobacter parvus TaxID=2939690 RepID=A0ABT1XF24_9BURK|nr:DoxX family protein [Limnobacter parvus]MCR2745881.1 DoxX family protein [Limnobacter parvus]
MTTAHNLQTSSNFIDNAFNSSASTIALIGRVLLAAMFVLAGIEKISGFEGTAGYIASVGLPFSEVLTVLTIAVEIGAGLALIVGFQARIAALLLAGFTLAASVLFHNYWAMPAEQAYVQQLMFMKNISVAGGLLMIVALGGGSFSLGRKN